MSTWSQGRLQSDLLCWLMYAITHIARNSFHCTFNEMNLPLGLIHMESQLLSLKKPLEHGLYFLKSCLDCFMQQKKSQDVFQVGSSFLLNKVPSLTFKKCLSCRHPCQNWDLRLGTMCEVASPNFHALNGSDCTDWPHVNWDSWVGRSICELALIVVVCQYEQRCIQSWANTRYSYSIAWDAIYLRRTPWWRRPLCKGGQLFFSQIEMTWKHY